MTDEDKKARRNRKLVTRYQSRVTVDSHDQGVSTMNQWYLSYDGNQLGPMDINQATAYAQSNANGYAWREGFGEWLPDFR